MSHHLRLGGSAMNEAEARRCIKAIADYLSRTGESPRAAADLLEAVRVLQHRKSEQVGALLDEIRDQYERRQSIYESAGGDPKKMQGNLTCYLPYDMLREVFNASPKPRR